MIIKYINSIIILPFIFSIKIYQFFISPVLKTNCRFIPTCSEYTILSLKEHGLGRGLFLSLRRILKCHPFGNKGYDPVSKKIKKEI